MTKSSNKKLVSNETVVFLVCSITFVVMKIQQEFLKTQIETWVLCFF